MVRAPAVGGFAFAMGAIIWAWINYSWFASAFDTDDWAFRVMTMVQMTGVIILAIGIPPMFASIDAGASLDTGVLVAGYVVMRLAMVGQWLRAAAGDPTHRRIALTYALFIGIAQFGWVLTAILPLGVLGTLIAAALLWVLELSGPYIAERRGVARGEGMTPWHPHHIAERYSLLAIIALGETVLGTLSAAQAVSATQGWSLDAVAVIGAGVALTFALWWTYFLLPSGPVLEVARDRAFPWGYGHYFVFAAIAAVGAGLHVLGYVFDDHYHVTTLTAISSIAVPVIVYLAALLIIHALLLHGWPHGGAVKLTGVALAVLSIVAAAAGLPLWLCLLIVLAAPVSLVVAYEVGMWRPLTEQLDRVVSTPQP
ncbi:low temperature requirement protein A [Microbacterium sp. CJ88]|uniref:low temperature requirement protein A n=1 Tax=Microbacterium sp. CJ88 TaxID=3445672 RepID=UPI003F655E98